MCIRDSRKARQDAVRERAVRIQLQEFAPFRINQPHHIKNAAHAPHGIRKLPAGDSAGIRQLHLRQHDIGLQLTELTDSAETVSYTHLDVYKRQSPHSRTSTL